MEFMVLAISVLVFFIVSSIGYNIRKTVMFQFAMKNGTQE